MRGLGTLMHRAYLGTIDYEGETIEDAIAEVRKTFAGEHGALMNACSTLIERDRNLVSATLVTRWRDSPFIAFSMTDPLFKRRGLARACLISSTNKLAAAGERELRLVVTLANEPAMALYESLGFVVL